MCLFCRYIIGDQAWIGFNMLNSNSGFMWTDGTPVSVLTITAPIYFPPHLCHFEVKFMIYLLRCKSIKVIQFKLMF